jgi:molybdopterin molybdotransferase
LERWVGGGFEQVRVMDDENALTDLVAGAVGRGVDLVLVSGGAGAGVFDFGWKALERNGFELVFRGVAMKPGKPVIYARRGRTGAFVLPGNPLSHFVVLQTLVAEWLRVVSGDSRSPVWVRLPLAAGLNAGRDVREILWPGRIGCSGGRMVVEAGVWQSSGDVTGLGGVDVLIRIPAGTGDLEAGAEVTCLMARLI